MLDISTKMSVPFIIKIVCTFLCHFSFFLATSRPFESAQVNVEKNDYNVLGYVMFYLSVISYTCMCFVQSLPTKLIINCKLTIIIIIHFIR